VSIEPRVLAQAHEHKVRGSRFEVRGSRFEVRGSRFEVRGSRFEVRGSGSGSGLGVLDAGWSVVDPRAGVESG
jgi:hypothetical protein